MTVALSVINHGNHADDLVHLTVEGSGDAQAATLARGESVSLMSGETVTVTGMEHAGDTSCREHDAMAIMCEGVGADIVRTGFNPSHSGSVDRLKTLAAAFINEVEVAGKDGRLTALAKTAAEEAAMWAVKSVTRTAKSGG